jgi:hypothetical protein
MMEPQQATSGGHAAVPALARSGLRVEAVGADHLAAMSAGARSAVAELPGGLLPASAPPA